MSINQQGVKEILNKLEDSELFGLAATVTQGFLKNKLNCRNEAIEAVIKYSPDVQTILKRRVITRDILFCFLHENNITASLPSTKSDLICQILEHWNSKTIANLEEKTTQEAIVSSSQSEGIKEPETPSVNLLAKKFSEWFYMMLNENEPIGTVHFWPDAKLKINILPINKTEIVHCAEEISVALFNIKSEHKLFFNPNLTIDGVQGRMDPHGLVMVLACGTLHVNNECVGVFEQIFSLARDPFSDNNWKVKNSELNLRSQQNVHQQPNLKDNELTSDHLMLPES